MKEQEGEKCLIISRDVVERDFISLLSPAASVIYTLAVANTRSNTHAQNINYRGKTQDGSCSCRN